jgi:hypothetical protein
MAAEKHRSPLQDFLSERCICGNPKRTRMSHCGRCYKSLPKPMQTALWQRFGEGYEEAYADSVAWLRARWPQRNLSFTPEEAN